MITIGSSPHPDKSNSDTGEDNSQRFFMENTRDVDIDIEKGENRCKEEVNGDEGKKQTVVVKEKRKKRAARPPRHPRGLSLDAADQKLIREIKQLALLKKRERFKKVKPSNNTSLGIVFSFLFFILILIQGMRSSSTTPSSLTYFQEISPAESLRKSKKGYLISVGYTSSINSVVDRPVSSQNLIERVGGSDTREGYVRTSGR